MSGTDVSGPAYTAKLYYSNKKNKRLTVLIRDNYTGKHVTVDFGSKKGKTFLDHNDVKKKENYLKRHGAVNNKALLSNSEDWTDPFTAGFWSRWLLWSEPTFKEALQLIANKFDVAFV